MQYEQVIMNDQTAPVSTPGNYTVCGWVRRDITQARPGITRINGVQRAHERYTSGIPGCILKLYILAGEMALFESCKLFTSWGKALQNFRSLFLTFAPLQTFVFCQST
jgi:hypothetical protein